MKWISLSTRKPPEDGSYPMRLKSKDECFGSDDILEYRKRYIAPDSPHSAYDEIVEVQFRDYTHSWPTTVVEWLDEDEVDSALNDIDMELAHMESYLHGGAGSVVSELRGKINKLLYG